jgi:uncharacterized protein (TIGR02118 family)
MFRIVSLLRRKPGMSHEDFLHHWREVHVPMIERNADVLGVVRYSIVAATEPEATARFNPAWGTEDRFDGVGELWLDDSRRVTEPPSPEAAAILAELAADEVEFVDRDRSYTLVGEETSIIDGTPA